MSTANGITTNGPSSSSSPKITLYTNHGCPYAHRVHIALKELGLSYEEVTIDLEKPREEWYLKLNPRGLVPTIRYNDEIITESSIITQFLADAHPSHLVPASNAPDGPLTRARIAFFADTYNVKIMPVMMKMFTCIGRKDDEGVRTSMEEVLAALKTDVEPLLEPPRTTATTTTTTTTSGKAGQGGQGGPGPGPFFGGSHRLTLAECLTAGFVIRWYAYARGGLVPTEFVDRLDELKNFSSWGRKLTECESVMYIFDEESIIEGTKRMIEKKFGRK